MAKYDYRDKVVVITGATSGIGRALAYEFAERGSRVVIAARRLPVLEEITADITLKGGKVAWCEADVSKEADAERIIKTALKFYGRIDVLICNAGLSMRALFDDVDLDVLHRLMNVNFWGCVNCCKYALPHLQKTKGTIIGLSSVAGLHGMPGRSGYSAAKFAMRGFLEALRIENKKKGVRVIISCPGFTASNVRFSALTADGTPQRESPRTEEKMMTPEHVAKKIANVIGKRKTLQTMELEGRATRTLSPLFPRLVDYLFYKVLSKEPDSPFI